MLTIICAEPSKRSKDKAILQVGGANGEGLEEDGVCGRHDGMC
jgi:hypothetical protein